MNLLVAATVIAAALLIVLTVGRPGYVLTGALVAIATVRAGIVQQFGLNTFLGLRRFGLANFYGVVPNVAFALAAPALLSAGRASFVELTVAYTISHSVFTPLTLRSAWRHAKTAQTGVGEAPSTSWMLRLGERAVSGANRFWRATASTAQSSPDGASSSKAALLPKRSIHEVDGASPTPVCAVFACRHALRRVSGVNTE